jgi:hypothetical protein
LFHRLPLGDESELLVTQLLAAGAIIFGAKHGIFF